MAMRAGTIYYRSQRPKTLAHIQLDLVKFLHQYIPENKPKPKRRHIVAAKQALTILRQATSK